MQRPEVETKDTNRDRESGRKKSSPATVRRHVMLNLIRMAQDRSFVNRLAYPAEMDERNRRKMLEYMSGITRWQRRLDFIISTFYKGRFQKLEHKLLQILRIGVYDLLFLDTPTHAAIHEAVALAKQEVRFKAGGLTNALLRNVLAHRDRLPRPAFGDRAEDLAVWFSHPTWMVRRWLARWDLNEVEALLASNNERPVFGLRINVLKTSINQFTERLDRLDIKWQQSTHIPYFILVSNVQAVLEAGLVTGGLCAIQDEAAGLIGKVLDPQPGDVVADVCAAPGSKALHAALMMGDQGKVVAFDVSRTKLDLLQRAAIEQGLKCIVTEACDVREKGLGPDVVQADRVLLDVPCSGLGVLAKRADLRWNRMEASIQDLVALQDQLLDAAARMVKPGGCLVYSTCTIEPEENECRVRAFLDRNPTFVLESVQGLIPDSMVTPEGYFQSLPHHHHTDGAFAARLRYHA